MHLVVCLRSNSPFKNAINGFKWAIRSQANYQMHLIISIIVMLASYILNISYFEWLLVIFAITIGLVVEAINTAIEATTDAITKEWKKEIKIAKDVSAAAMLTYVVGVSILALLIFVQKIINLMVY